MVGPTITQNKIKILLDTRRGAWLGQVSVVPQEVCNSK